MPKTIRGYVGGPETGTAAVSIAQMSSPAGWEEPGQRPEFDEYTVLRGALTAGAVLRGMALGVLPYPRPGEPPRTAP